MRRDGFTLVELLVVVGIIAALLTLIVPALGRAKDQARLVACQSNLKQIGTAVHAYAHDYRGHIPFGPGQSDITMFDFYRFPGMVTSIVATNAGKPVGLGLAIEDHMGESPEVIFCPGADQKVLTAEELAKFGRSQVQSSYWYRHGDAGYPNDPVTNINIAGKPINRISEPLKAIAMDSNFVTDGQLSGFGVEKRTHHEQKQANILFLDASAGTHANADDRFSADVGSNPQDGPDLMLKAFEAADRVK